MPGYQPKSWSKPKKADLMDKLIKRLSKNKQLCLTYKAGPMAYPEELGMLRPAEGQKVVPKVDPK